MRTNPMLKAKTQFTDQQFIEGLRTGNSEVLEGLYKKYYQFVLKLILNNNGSHEAAEDIYQETIIIVYENAQKPQFELSCQLQTYIYSIAKRLWLKQLRNNGKTFLFKEDEENEVVDVNEDVINHEEKENDNENNYWPRTGSNPVRKRIWTDQGERRWFARYL